MKSLSFLDFFQLDIFLIFVFAGIIKGLIGMGVPMITLSLMSVFQPIPSAVVITLLPSFLTNIWQAARGGNFRILWSKLWGMMLMVPGGIWLGSEMLRFFDPSWFSVLLGGLLILFAIASLSGFIMRVPQGRENRWGAVVGILSGLVTGMTGIFSVPTVFYLHGLELTRDQLIQALGILFVLATIFLAAALQRIGVLHEKQLMLSVGALFGTICGMLIGQQIRRYISEGLFRKIFLSFLMVLGTYIVTNALNDLGVLIFSISE